MAQIPSALQKMRMAGGALLSFAMMAVLTHCSLVIHEKGCGDRDEGTCARDGRVGRRVHAREVSGMSTEVAQGIRRSRRTPPCVRVI
jgi:hypothetical protein